MKLTEEDGRKRFVYLLDETLDLDHVGLISTNMAELLVKGLQNYLTENVPVRSVR